MLALCEGAVCVALAYAFSFFKVKLWANGGSIDLVMVPLVVFARRRGAGAVCLLLEKPMDRLSKTV